MFKQKSQQSSSDKHILNTGQSTITDKFDSGYKIKGSTKDDLEAFCEEPLDFQSHYLLIWERFLKTEGWRGSSDVLDEDVRM